MDEIIGFCALKGGIIAPPWLKDYPWLNMAVIDKGDWRILVWGHGDLSSRVSERGIIVGNEGNRCVRIVPVGETLSIRRDYLGQIPVYHAGDCVSTCEECVILSLRKVTLNRAYLPLFLQIGASVGPYTLWNEIGQLYGDYSLSCLSSQWMGAELAPADWDAAIRGVVDRAVNGKVHLAMSSGYDSRLLAVHMKPENIKAWTLPLTSDRRDGEYVWAHRTAEILGIEHNPVIIEDFPNWMQKLIEYMGATTSAMMACWFAAIGTINQDERRPMVHGVPGDTLSGNPVDRTLRVVKQMPSADAMALELIRDRGAGWSDEEMDQFLTYEWREGMAGLGDTFEQTQGPNFTARADLFRVRTRSAALTGRINCGELWGGSISPYADSQYAAWALHLPVEDRAFRSGQVKWATEKWPHIFERPSPLQDEDYTPYNTLDEDLACDPWPLMGTRFNELFNQDYISDLVNRALDRDMWAIRRAWTLQPIAWAFMRGYVE